MGRPSAPCARATTWSSPTAAASRSPTRSTSSPVEPTKIVCVHLNYRSRVDEFVAKLGPAPTYFHKPSPR